MNSARRPGTVPGSYPVPTAPVLLAAPAEEEPALGALRRACLAFGWSVVEERDAGRLAWAASVHRPAAVIVPVREAGPSVRVIADLRAATAGALVAVGDLSSPDVLAVLRAGADVVIPSGLPDEEVLARVYAVVRRVSENLTPSMRYLVAGPLRVDLWQRSVRHGDTPVHLTATEFDLLAHLMRNAGRAQEPTAIVSRVWGHGGVDGRNTLRIFVGRLRAKLGDNARRPTLLESVRGHGYRFALPVVELPDEARTGLTAGDQVEHLDGLAEVAEALSRCATEDDLARTLVDEVVDRGLADGAGRTESTATASSSWPTAGSTAPTRAGRRSWRRLRCSC